MNPDYGLSSMVKDQIGLVVNKVELAPYTSIFQIYAPFSRLPSSVDEGESL
jgi:hypothetical protein